jgi:hypothetical protein
MAYLAFLLAPGARQIGHEDFLARLQPSSSPWNLELTITRSAGANCRDCSKPFDDSKSALFHAYAVGATFSSTQSWIVTHP